MLWHRVTVETEAPVPRTGTSLATWSIEPLVEVDYQIAHEPDGCYLFHRGDLVARCPDLDAAVSTLHARAGAEAFELAARRGWTPFRGAMIRQHGQRICILGSPDPVASDATQIESSDGWVVRDGEFLAATFDGSSDVSHLSPAPVDDVKVRVAGQPSRRAGLADLLAAADRSVLSSNEIVHAVSDVLRILPALPLP